VLLKTSLDRSILTNLRNSSHFYQSAIDNIKYCVAALDSKGDEDANEFLAAAADNTEKCEVGFRESGRTSPPTIWKQSLRTYALLV
jgi:hypothetical protein